MNAAGSLRRPATSALRVSSWFGRPAAVVAQHRTMFYFPVARALSPPQPPSRPFPAREKQRWQAIAQMWGGLQGRPRQRLTPTSYTSHLESSLGGACRIRTLRPSREGVA